MDLDLNTKIMPSNSFVNATNHRFNETSPLRYACTCAILVGGVCDLLNLENNSAKSFSHGNPRKSSTSKIEHYTVVQIVSTS